uniref:Uncharacterized protein n=1 Tax=Brassica oleracea var. oleracea TaxID=109376 RepID=A0A0D3DMT9_BRAOL
MAATKISGFGYEGFSDLEDFWDDLPVSRLKYNADFQEVFQTTSRKSSGLPGSLLTKSPFHNRSERFGFSDLDLICRKSSRRLPGSLPDDFLEVFRRSLPFITDLGVLVFNQMVHIFHSFKDLDLDMQVFQIWKTSGTTYLLVV